MLKRSRKVIANFLKDPGMYGTEKSSGRPEAVSARETRAILKIAVNSRLTCHQIAAEAGVETNVRNVQRYL
jgi:hypothetical protein